jgi:PAS domain S-box-containing protein
MRCKLPVSDNPAKYSSPRGSVHPAQLEDLIPGSPDDRPGRSPALYLIIPAPGKTGGTWPHRPYDPPHAGNEKRIPLASRVSAAMDVENMDHDLHQARDNFATIFHASPAILCIIQLNSLRYSEINKAYEQHTGYSRSEVLGRPSLKLGLWSNVEDRKRMFQKLLAKGRLPGHQEVFQTKSGESLTTFLSAEIIEFDGEPCALVVAEDITRRRQAEEARMDLAQRLINAQEAECTRVARELHDNIGQSLAIFTMDLERTRSTLAGLSAESDAKLARLCGKLKDLGRVVGNLSHQLHSSELELLGLAVAVKALGREFSEQYHVQVLCRCSGVPDNLSADVSLCLFRVMQEALHNVAKHSQATKIDVDLQGTPTSLRLSISDDGVGFTPNAANARPGLGLTSMRERLHLIGGKFAIISKPGSGTRIEATVPMTKTEPATILLHQESVPSNYRPVSLA